MREQNVTLIYSDLNDTTLLFLEKIDGRNKILISDDNHQQVEVHQIKKSSSYIIPKLEQKIEKAIIWVKTEKDIKNAKEIIGKCIKDKAKTLVLIDAQNSDTILKKHKAFLKETGASIGIVGDIFDSEVSTSNLSKIFQNAIGTCEIELEYEDNSEIAIISQRNFLESVIDLLNTKTQKVALLFYEKPRTRSTAVFELVKEFPEIRIVYTTPKRLPVIKHEKIIKSAVVSLEKKPMYTLAGKGFKEEIRNLKKIEIKMEEKKKPKKRRPKTGLTKIVATCAISMTLFMLASFSIYATGLAHAKNAMDDLGKLNISAAKSNLEKSEKLLNFSSPVVLTTLNQLPFTNNLTHMMYEANALLILANKVTQELQHTNITEIGDHKTIASFTSLYLKLSNSSFTKYLPKHELFTEDTSKIVSILQSTPEVLGAKSEKNYLLVFQNNAELRPTGGFIGSVGDIQVKEGKVQEITIRDVYELDGQLNEHIEPHYIIRKHLQPHLYLRDSNFNIEFAQSAEKIAQIYFAQTGKTVDGVIAIDFEVMKEIIKEVGTIELSTHNLTLAPNDARQIIHEQIHEGFTPGSTEKKDILESLLAKIIVKMEQNPELSLSILKKLPNLISEKHIMFTFKNENLQSLFEANNLTGSITDNRITDETSRNDIFGINEANIGVNKANEHIQRKVEYTAHLKKNKILSQAKIYLFNTSPKGQDYKAYVRLIAPNGSKIESIKINGEKKKIITAITDPKIYEAPSYTPASGFEVDEFEEDEFKTFGFTTTVPKKRAQAIEIIYESGIDHQDRENIKYSLMYIKQPGTTEYPLQITLNAQEGKNIQSDELRVENRKASLKKVVKKDQIINATITD